MKTIVLLSCLALTSISSTLLATDLENGKSLHNENCMSCHSSDKYTAKMRRVQSLASLTSQVKRCDFSLGTQWFDEDIDDVVNYLNTTYYHVK
ncbi:MAG: green heme protein [Piscirickettsiaceae bacterium]|nr:MAG: green heme protein [Piscirickettsiaceae bacterium]